MIRSHITALIPCALITILASQVAAAEGSNSTLTLSGKVEQSSCTLSETTTPHGNDNTAFSPSTGSRRREIKLSLALNCSSAESGTLHFIGEPVTNDPTQLKNTSASNPIRIEKLTFYGNKMRTTKGGDEPFGYQQNPGTKIISLGARMVPTEDMVRSVITIEITPN
jgi:type 1 fimbria pilin